MKARTVTLAALILLLFVFPTLLAAQSRRRSGGHVSSAPSYHAEGALGSLPATTPTVLFRANVPFDYVAGGNHLPPGQYVLAHINPDLILLEKEDGRATAMVPIRVSRAKAGQAATKLVFNKYENQYFLSEVWTERDEQVHQCSKSSAERALTAKHLQPQSVTLAQR